MSLRQLNLMPLPQKCPQEHSQERPGSPARLARPEEVVSHQPRELWAAVHLPGCPSEKILTRLATRTERFTPRVSLAPPDGLLLEVKGSLHLFGGAAQLCAALAGECRLAAVQAVCALAPTPLAALAFARAGRADEAAQIVEDSARLTGKLARLPLRVLRWPLEVVRRLAKVGVYTIGQALRLPRKGFARRFGVAQLAMLDRLLGRIADPRSSWQPRERFRRRCEFTFEIESQALVLELIEPVLGELESFLRARASGITHLECRLVHRQGRSSRCVLKLAAPAADARRLQVLLGERLMGLRLSEPVRACELLTGWIVPRAPEEGSLWRGGEHGGKAGREACELIEHLRARLGAEAVYGLAVQEDHRPEAAWRVVEPGSAFNGYSPAGARRPLWLLPAPRLLERSPRFLAGPERIETGWWDGAEAARDYYAAVDEHGVRLWVFREQAAPRRWFLQGVFG